MKKFITIFTGIVGVLGLVFFTAQTVTAGYNPSGAKTTSTVGEFRHASPFSYNYVFDVKQIWVPFTPMNFAATSDGDITTSVVGLHSGGTALAEINSSDIMGITANADNDALSWMIPLPKDIDLAQPIYIRYLFSESSSGTGSIQVTTQYTPIVVGTTALAAQTTTTGVTDADAIATSATAYALQWTGLTTIAASTFSGTPGDDMLVFESTIQLTTVTDCTVYGAQVKYSRKWLGGDNY